MAKVVYDNLTAGTIPDLPSWNLPPEGFSDSRNIRYRDGAAEKCRGHSQVFGNLSATAWWAAPISDGTNYLWAYGSQSALYATDGTSHANVASISYNADSNLNWTGGPYNGYMLANDGTNPPQTWSPNLTNKFQPLANWPASTTAKVIRTFKQFILALRVTEGGVYNPRVIRWSTSTLPGALPASWDYTDPSNDAGRNELAQTGDLLVDCLPLRDVNIVYKEQFTWLMEYIGDSSVFGFRQLFSQVGMFAENCAASFKNMHLVLTDSDVIVHDGNDAQSIANLRVRRWLFNRININKYKTTFVTADYRNREIWICFPEAGYDWPNMALVWNWADNTWYPRELGQQMAFGTHGVIPGTNYTFDSDSGTFDGGPGYFDEEAYNPQALKLVLLDATAKKAYQADEGETWGGISKSCYALRESVALMKDISRTKRILRVFPKVLGTPGDTLKVYVGSRSAPDADVLWSGPFNFTIGVDNKVDCRVNGRVFDVRFQYDGTNTFRLFGYDIEYEPQGYR